MTDIDPDSRLARLKPRQRRQDASLGDFLRLLPRAFIYPGRGRGGAMLAAVAVVLTATAIVAWLTGLVWPGASTFLHVMVSFIIVVMTAGQFTQIMLSTGEGEDMMPEWPDFTDVWGQILRPFVMILGSVMVPILPAILYFMIYPSETWSPTWITSDPSRPLALWNLLWACLFSLLPLGEHTALLTTMRIVAAVYFPMSLLSAAMANSLSGLNPLRVLRAIVLTPLRYLCVFLVIAIEWVAAVTLIAVLLRYVPLIGGILASIALLYAMFAMARCMGLFYRCHASRLNWIPE